MFEGALYFILGFLCAALIALMVSPAIWNRAVTLTKRRIESSVPLTLNEIQADKDQLRAEFAMSTRRLELSVEELREKAARQVIDINRKRDELAKLAEESREKIRMVEELEARSAELRSRLADREEALSAISRQRDDARQELERRALELEKLRHELEDARSESDSRRIELVARQTAVDDMTSRIGERDKREAKLQAEIDELRAALAAARGEVKTLTGQGEEGDARLARLQKLNGELEERLQRAERQVSEYRNGESAEADSSNELTRLLMEERERSNGLEADLASTVLRMDALLQDASNENVRKAMDTLSAEKDRIEKQLGEALAERDRLMEEVTAFRESHNMEWEGERKENAILRERINDLAAQVTAMTAALEGPDSPIRDIIEQATGADKPAPKGQKTSQLAERIRALQETARLHQS